MLCLRDDDLLRWAKAVARIPDASALMQWLQNDLQAFFPFARALLIHGELLMGRIEITHCLPVGHAPQLLEQIAGRLQLEERGSLRWWLENRAPLLIDPNRPAPYVSAFELAEIAQHNLGNVAAHGIVNARNTAGTYFSFCGVPGPLSDWHHDALRLIAPVLNDLLLRYIAQGANTLPPTMACLNESEQALVRLLAQGMDDKTIATRMQITEKAVRNRLSRVYARLGITRRTQLMAMLR